MVVRLLRRLLVVLVVLAVLAGAGNVWLASAAEKKAAEQIQREFDLDAPPTVQIEGFPILLRVLQGRIPRVTVEGRETDVQGLEVARFRVEMDGIRASLSDIRNGVKSVRVGGGEAFMEVAEEATNAYLERQKVELDRLRFLDGRVQVIKSVRYLKRPYVLEATGTLEIDGRHLVFSPETVTANGGPPPRGFESRAERDASFRVALPALPGGIRARRVRVQPGLARLEAEFGAVSLDLTSS